MPECEKLKAFMAELKSVVDEDDKAFCALLNKGVGLLELTNEDIAHEFGCSRPTVARWLEGKSAPHPLMRKYVYQWLQRRAEQR